MKKITMITLACIMALSLVLSSVSAKNKETNEMINIYKTKQDITSSETGEVVGTSIYRTKVKTSTNKEGHKVTTIFTYATYNYYNGDRKEETFSDEFVLVNEKEIYVNGEFIDPNTEIKLENINDKGIMSSDGGVSYLSHYKQENIPSYGFIGGYTMKSYPGVKSKWYIDGMMLDPGSETGTQITRYNWINGTYNNQTRWFMNYADQVDSSRTTISVSAVSLMAALGVAVLTVPTIIGSMGSAGTAALLAIAIYNASNSGRSAVENAYQVLYSIPSGVR